MGYITPEITGKLPYYPSLPAGLRAADVPNGLAASPNATAAGRGQILGHMAFRDTSPDQPPGTSATKGAFGFKALTASDPSAKAAFENELRVQAPFGFWDPAGFPADGGSTSSSRRRHAEIMHGRMVMIAAIGYTTPEITGKLPGASSSSSEPPGMRAPSLAP
eukprot:6524617-Heterocapsa_arctica.AAC.1